MGMIWWSKFLQVLQVSSFVFIKKGPLLLLSIWQLILRLQCQYTNMQPDPERKLLQLIRELFGLSFKMCSVHLPLFFRGSTYKTQIHCLRKRSCAVCLRSYSRTLAMEDWTSSVTDKLAVDKHFPHPYSFKCFSCIRLIWYICPLLHILRGQTVVPMCCGVARL